MSGGQAKNLALMQLFANTCDLPVVLPFSHSGAVVLGAAILARFAVEVEGIGKELTSEEQTKMLWGIMVGLLIQCEAC
jgi:ribulose kinase